MIYKCASLIYNTRDLQRPLLIFFFLFFFFTTMSIENQMTLWIETTTSITPYPKNLLWVCALVGLCSQACHATTPRNGLRGNYGTAILLSGVTESFFPQYSTYIPGALTQNAFRANLSEAKTLVSSSPRYRPYPMSFITNFHWAYKCIF